MPISSFERAGFCASQKASLGWCAAEKRLIFLVFTTPGSRHIGFDSFFVGDFQ